MTTVRMEPSVLIIGRSQRVLDDAVAELRALGYRAAATNDFFGDISGLYAPDELDAVVFGGQVPADRKAELAQEIAAANSRVMFIQGLAGIPGLIVHQVQAAFRPGRGDAAQAPIYEPRARTITLRLTSPEDVTVTAWWTTSVVPPDPTSDSLVLLDERLPTGDHEIPIPDRIPGERAFATVQLEAAIHAFSIEAAD